MNNKLGAIFVESMSMKIHACTREAYISFLCSSRHEINNQSLLIFNAYINADLN